MNIFGVKKTVGGTTTHHLWDRGNIAAEVTGTTKTAYVRGRGLVYSRKGTTDSYYIRNKYGDIYKILNGSGTVQKTYKYDAFGVEDSPSGSDANPFRYRGEYFDKETGTYYLRARYYAPGIGRFTSADPARHGTNGYIYCGNDPIMYIDPSGLRPGGLLGSYCGTQDEDIEPEFYHDRISKYGIIFVNKEELSTKDYTTIIRQTYRVITRINSDVDGRGWLQEIKNSTFPKERAPGNNYG